MASAAHPFVARFPACPERRIGVTPASLADGSSAEEARLARRAVAGDGDAFAELYTRYEKRAYNLCLRILGSEEDAADATQEAFVKVLRRLPKLEGRDLAFGSYLFTSARHACYDLIERRRRTEPSDEIPEGATPVGGGVGGGGFGFDPGDPRDDPERNVLVSARQDEIREANAQLPERQREVLALRELEDLSYDEIAEIMEMNRNSVAQLISRARINLRDALRGTALASIAVSSADCERALPLLAARQDGQAAEDEGWLDRHLLDCKTCHLAREAMEEAGVSYRAWLPVAAAPLLFRETLARAAEAVGADWSDVAARREARDGTHGLRARLRSVAGTGAPPGSARASLRRHRKRDLALIGGLAAVLLLVLFATGLREGAPVEETLPVADEAAPAAAEEPERREPAKRKKAKPAKEPEQTPAAAAAAVPDDPEPSEEAEPTPTPVDTHSAPAAGERRSPKRGTEDTTSRRGGGGDESLAGDEPPPPPPPPSDPPPEPPVTDPPVTEPPPAGVPGCRDAAGNPIPCPPPRPPCTGVNCPGQPPPPRQPPPSRPPP